MNNAIGGKYRLLADLGQGGTANVSLAVASGSGGFNKLVVLKMMKSSLVDEPEQFDMFMSEARLAARLNHPNIVQTNEVFEHNKRPVIVMEYLDGQSLYHVASRDRRARKLTLAMHLRVLSEVLNGLEYAHELCDFDGQPLGLVHRDVSPQNVFITFDGQVKLLDFGIAKMANSRSETETGVIKGKARYMPPEQIAARGVDHRADIFPVGVMLWEAVTGTRMWADQNDMVIFNQLLNGQLPTPTSVNADVDPELERIVMKALALDRDKRYASAAEMQAAIDEYAAGLGTQIRARDIGKVASELFADQRNQTRLSIEAQLSKVASLSDAEYAQARPIELDFVTQSVTTLQSGRAQRKLGSYIALSAALLLFGAGGWFVARSPLALAPEAASAPALVTPSATASSATAPSAAAPSTRPPSATAPSSRPPSAMASRASAPATVRLLVTAFPATAKIFLDRERLPSNPFAEDLPRDERKHVLRFEADGYRSEEREIVLQESSEIVETLEELPSPVAAERPRASSPRPVRPAPRVEPPRVVPAAIKPERKPDCEPPFNVDARGVKRYKLQCI